MIHEEFNRAFSHYMINRYCNEEVKKMGVPVQSAGSIENFFGDTSTFLGSSDAFILEMLEEKLEPFENQLQELNRYSAKLTQEYNSKVS